MEMLSQGWEGTRSGEYSPNFLLVGLQVEHITRPFTQVFANEPKSYLPQNALIQEKYELLVLHGLFH